MGMENENDKFTVPCGMSRPGIVATASNDDPFYFAGKLGVKMLVAVLANLAN
jgi:hypothetical protein